MSQSHLYNRRQRLGIHNTVMLSVVLETRYWSFYKNPYESEYLLSNEKKYLAAKLRQTGGYSSLSFNCSATPGYVAINAKIFQIWLSMLQNMEVGMILACLFVFDKSLKTCKLMNLPGRWAMCNSTAWQSINIYNKQYLIHNSQSSAYLTFHLILSLEFQS
jgi:hypothetical protein